MKKILQVEEKNISTPIESGCAVLTSYVTSLELFDSLLDNDILGQVTHILGEPIGGKKHVLCCGFIEGSGGYKKFKDLISLYQGQNYGFVVLVTSTALKKNSGLTQFLDQESIEYNTIDDSERIEENISLDEKYFTLDKEFSRLNDQYDLTGCVSIGRQTLFPFSAKKHHIDYCIIHGSAPSVEDISYEKSKQGYPIGLHDGESYNNAKLYSITSLIVPTFPEELQDVLFSPSLPPYSKQFEQELLGKRQQSFLGIRKQLVDSQLLPGYTLETPMVFVSWSETLFDEKNVNDPDANFILQDILQTKDSFDLVLSVCNALGKRIGKKIMIVAHKKIVDLYSDNYFQFIDLAYLARKPEDHEHEYLRGAGVELNRAAQSGATSLGYGSGSGGIITTVPYKTNESKRDYMYETATAEIFEKRGLPVVKRLSDGSIDSNHLFVLIKQWLFYKNPQSMMPSSNYLKNSEVSKPESTILSKPVIH